MIQGLLKPGKLIQRQGGTLTIYADSLEGVSTAFAVPVIVQETPRETYVIEDRGKPKVFSDLGPPAMCLARYLGNGTAELKVVTDNEAYRNTILAIERLRQ